jgi:hypothetical protein
VTIQGLLVPPIPRIPHLRLAALGAAVAITLLIASSPAGAQDPAPPPITGSHAHPVPSWGKPLPYPVVIADRRNHRLLEVTPDKQVIWRFESPDRTIYHDNDDVYFTPDGKLLAISEEDNQDIHLVDYYERQLVWSYGMPDVPGPGEGQLNFPDDTHVLADGTILVADIRNCRVLFIDRESATVKVRWGGLSHKDGKWQHVGKDGKVDVDPSCRHDPPHRFGLPNGVVELEGGDILISEIIGAWITRITRTGEVIWSRQAPGGIRYPSDAMPTMDGQVVVADYAKPGRVVIFNPKTGNVTWNYFEKSGEGMLDHPSLAMELPTGDVMLNDDYRHRVIIIDRVTKKITWQYGETDRKGSAPGLLNNPDGIDIDVFRDWKAALAPAKGN